MFRHNDTNYKFQPGLASFVFAYLQRVQTIMFMVETTLISLTEDSNSYKSHNVW